MHIALHVCQIGGLFFCSTEMPHSHVYSICNTFMLQVLCAMLCHVHPNTASLELVACVLYLKLSSKKKKKK